MLTHAKQNWLVMWCLVLVDRTLRYAIVHIYCCCFCCCFFLRMQIVLMAFPVTIFIFFIRSPLLLLLLLIFHFNHFVAKPLVFLSMHCILVACCFALIKKLKWWYFCRFVCLFAFSSRSLSIQHRRTFSASFRIMNNHLKQLFIVFNRFIWLFGICLYEHWIR